MDASNDRPSSTPHLGAVIYEYFYSGRPYKIILERLKRIHGVKKSMSWLKRQLRRLRLKRRCPDPPEESVKTIIVPIVKTSDRLRGYRAVWRILHRKFRLRIRRDTVMRMMRQIDPLGVEVRKKRRLKRRIYTAKPVIQ
ncbi:uncharacterized protein [Dysidea avara]|uniref:uncharacterized protein isoform X2 n=1 Tax=Dysidea avara TaxID=196820 RepID=UPI00332E3E47